MVSSCLAIASSRAESIRKASVICYSCGWHDRSLCVLPTPPRGWTPTKVHLLMTHVPLAGEPTEHLLNSLGSAHRVAWRRLELHVSRQLCPPAVAVRRITEGDRDRQRTCVPSLADPCCAYQSNPL